MSALFTFSFWPPENLKPERRPALTFVVLLSQGIVLKKEGARERPVLYPFTGRPNELSTDAFLRALKGLAFKGSLLALNVGTKSLATLELPVFELPLGGDRLRFWVFEDSLLKGSCSEPGAKPLSVKEAFNVLKLLLEPSRARVARVKRMLLGP